MLFFGVPLSRPARPVKSEWPVGCRFSVVAHEGSHLEYVVDPFALSLTDAGRGEVDF